MRLKSKKVYIFLFAFQIVYVTYLRTAAKHAAVLKGYRDSPNAWRGSREPAEKSDLTDLLRGRSDGTSGREGAALAISRA